MMVGQHIGPFEIKQEIGSGAMGTVYKAAYQDGRVVALKVISFGLAGNETALKRFEREAEILKQLKHKNIVRLFGAGRTAGMPYFAMEFVEGESLDQVLARRIRFSWEEVVSIGQQVCAALQHAHEKGIIHRDLKPSNLMYIENGTIKLTDFGIAKDMDVTALTGANCTVGTAAYMSPEQCKGESITAKSDIYSLGVVLFELLTGRKPFIAESPVDMFMKHVNEPAPRPNWSLKGSSTGEIPTWLETTVLQMMEKKPEHRPLNAEMVGKSLQEGLDGYYAGKSAAVGAVEARAGDRRIQTSVIDETDREAARTLRGVLKKKRIRKKSQPFYARGWFVFLAVPLVLLAFVGILRLILRPPSAETLFDQAERRINSQEYREALTRLNGSDGPIREFLQLYPDDPNAKQVLAWRDLAETTLFLDKVKHNARGPKVRKLYEFGEKVDDNYEDQVGKAVRYEDYGDLWYASKRWEDAKNLVKSGEENRIARRTAEMQWDRLSEQYRIQKEKDPEKLGSEKSYRKWLLEHKLEDALRAKSQSRLADLKRIADETKALYGDENDPEISKLVAMILAEFKSKTDEKK